MKNHPLILAIAICFFAICTTFSQKKQDTKIEPLLEIKSNILAVDNAGKSVDNLKSEDFKIFEDGVEQKINFFAKKENTLNVVLVADNTGSMRSQLEKIVFISSTVIANLRPDDEAHILRFVSSDKIETLQDWTSDANLLNRAIQNMYPEGGQSAVIDALYLATEQALKREKNDQTKRYAIILISDGEDRKSYYTPEVLLKLLKNSDIQIFPFALSGKFQNDKTEKQANDFLNHLAVETGGAAFFLKKPDKPEITNQLKTLVTELRSQYIVGYVSTNPKRDGLKRKLTVNIANGGKDEKRIAFVRESFVVPENKK